jgi:anti-sigma factor RsiW
MLLDYLDGTISARDKQRVESQLAAPDVAKRLSQFAAAESMMETYFALKAPPAGFTNRVMQTVSEHAAAKSKTARFLPHLAILGGLCILMAGIYLGAGHYFDFQVNLPNTGSSFDFEHVTYGILFVLFLSLMWLMEKVWMQPIFNKIENSKA